MILRSHGGGVRPPPVSVGAVILAAEGRRSVIGSSRAGETTYRVRHMYFWLRLTTSAALTTDEGSYSHSLQDPMYF